MEKSISTWIENLELNRYIISTETGLKQGGFHYLNQHWILQFIFSPPDQEFAINLSLAPRKKYQWSIPDFQKYCFTKTFHQKEFLKNKPTATALFKVYLQKMLSQILTFFEDNLKEFKKQEFQLLISLLQIVNEHPKIEKQYNEQLRNLIKKIKKISPRYLTDEEANIREFVKKLI